MDERLTQIFTDIANSIRNKGVTGTMTPNQMADKISTISSGGGDHTQEDKFLIRTLTSYSSENVTNLNNSTFAWCSSLTSVSIPNVTSIYSYAFQKCSSLTDVSLPNVSLIGTYAFNDCSKLNLIDFSGYTGTTIPTLKNVNAFNGLPGTYEIKVPPSLYTSWKTATNWSSIADHIKMNANFAITYSDESVYGVMLEGAMVTSEDIPETYGEEELTKEDITKVQMFDGIAIIADSTFSLCNQLESVSGSSVTDVGNDAFQGCSSLSTIDFPNLTSIGSHSFEDCASLTEVNMDIEYVPEFAFSSCQNLTSVKFGSSLQNIECYAFQNCNNLMTIDLTNCPEVVYIEDLTPFEGMDQDYVIKVPASLYNDYLAEDETWGTISSHIQAITYTEVEYLQNTGTSYLTIPVDTLTRDDEIEICVAATDKGGKTLFGSTPRCAVVPQSAQMYYKIFSDGVSAPSLASYSTNHFYTFEYKNNCFTVYNESGVSVATNTSTLNQTTITPAITIFYRNGTSGSNANGKVKSIKIKRDGAYLVDAIPVVTADGVAEMYNKVDGSYLPRSGDLVAGPAV